MRMSLIIRNVILKSSENDFALFEFARSSWSGTLHLIAINLWVEFIDGTSRFQTILENELLSAIKVILL